MNDGEVIPISRDEVRITAKLDLDGKHLEGVISRVERTMSATEFFGWTVIDDVEYNFKHVRSNNPLVREATIQFNQV